MSIAYYTVDPVKQNIPIAYVVKVFKNGDCVHTVNFPVNNPKFPERTLNQACEFGRLRVRKIIDMELAK